MPVIVGPTGLAGLFWPDGERCAARAAQGGRHRLLPQPRLGLHDRDLAVTGAAPRWMQVFIYNDRGFTRELTERAKAAGYDALVLTIDNQLLGNRERDIRNGFTIPPSSGFAGLAGMALTGRLAVAHAARAAADHLRQLRPAGRDRRSATLAGRMATLLDPGMTWPDVDDLRRIWNGPLLLKGILHPDEAAEAVERGIDGIIVSNHGGRQLDGARRRSRRGRRSSTPSAAAFRCCSMAACAAAAMSSRRSRSARGLPLGRPQLWGLAVAGEAGVGRMLEIYRSEIDRVMGLCGITRIADIDRSVLLERPRAAAPRPVLP